MPIKVAIIEDQIEISEMLASIINRSKGFECNYVFSNVADAIVKIPTLNIDVVLVDIHLPGESGIECVLKLKPICSKIQFLMCTSLEDSETIFEALKAGANGYITKSITPEKLIEAIKDIFTGGSPMSSNIARKVVSSFNVRTHNRNLEVLSEREKDILLLLSKGLRYKEIADKLFLSIETVRTHIRNIYQKLQVNSRTDALNKVFKK